MGVMGCSSCIGDQCDITTSLMTMKTTTRKKAKTKNSQRKVREEKLEDM